MGIERAFFQPEPQRLPVDGLRHPRRHPRVTRQGARQGAATQLPAFSTMLTSKNRSALSQTGDEHGQPLARRAHAPFIFRVHVHERRHVKVLRMAEAQRLRPADPVALPEHVPVPLQPRSVGHLGDDGLDGHAAAIEAEIQVQGTEVVSEIAQEREQAHGTGRLPSGPSPDEIVDGLGEGNRRIAQVVLAPDGHGRQEGRAQADPAAGQRGPFGQIHVQHVQRVAEPMRDRAQAPMLDVSFVDAAQHDSSRLPKHSPTANALLTPSSWKPYPQ